MPGGSYEVFDPIVVSRAETKHIRNVCILAHVDHGKTTLSDHLISANGLISSRSAGHLRYLDSRADEQTRLITMKSSCITLSYRPPEEENTYWVNLIDSPGHVDFSSEVSAAARLCDGALLLVDATEGVCPQTRQVLFRAFSERLRLILVINKMDRLFTELRLSAEEVYTHVDNIIMDVNASMQQLLVEEAMRTAATLENNFVLESETQHFSIDDALEESVRFCPRKGNVLFCSSLDGWAFDLPTFALTLAQKLKIPETAVSKLVSALWGNYYMNSKTFAISRKPTTPSAKPMIIQLVFEQLHRIYYHASTDRFDEAAFQKIVNGLQLRVPQESLKTSTEALRAIMSTWLPLAVNLLRLPSPVDCADYRLADICPGYKQLLEQQTCSPWPCAKVLQSLQRCGRGASDDVVLYAAKFLSADLLNLRLTGDKLSGTERMSDFVALVRIFCGTLAPNMSLYVSGTEFSQHRTTSTRNVMLVVKSIYFLLGRDLVPTPTASAGSVVAVALQRQGESQGTEPDSMEDVIAWMMSLTNSHRREQEQVQRFTVLEEDASTRDTSLCSIDRCITLSSAADCPAFRTPYTEAASAIVRVCVEPVDVRDATAVLRGLAILYKADPGVEIDVLPTGEVTLGCSGEVHLEKCLNDLQNLYARVPLKVSPPLVAVRETFVNSKVAISGPVSQLPFPPWAGIEDGKPSLTEGSTSGYIYNNNTAEIHATPVMGTTPNGLYSFSVYARPIPSYLLQWLDENATEIETTLALRGGSSNWLRNYPDVKQTSRDENQQQRQAATYLQTIAAIQKEISVLWESPVQQKVRERVAQPGRLLPPSDEYLDPHFGEKGQQSLPGALVAIATGRGARNLLFWEDPIDFADGSTAVAYDSAMCLAYGASCDHVREQDKSSAAMPLSCIPCELYPIMPAIASGFQLASQAGPLCEEPIVGVAFVLKPLRVPSEESANSRKDAEAEKAGGGTSICTSQPYGPLSGQVMSCVKECCRRAFLQRSCVRVYEAMLRLNLHCEQEFLGRAYGVLAKRRGQIISEALREGTSLFAVEAFLPVIDSFGLALDLRSRASGHVAMHIQFSHWQMVEEDPFPEASMTEEELEDEGESGFLSFPSNTARRIIYNIRKRKGLPVDEKVVTAATKQRTLTRNK